MSIIRVEKNANYTTINNTVLKDNRLSWKAKGIIAYMLSMPDDWVFYISELVTHSTDGEKSFRSGLNELKKCGYVERKPVYKGSKIDYWETIIHEVPKENAETLDTSLLADFVHVENVHVGNVHVENDALLSTDIKLNTDITLNTNNIYIPNSENGKKAKNNTPSHSNEFEQFWSIYPRKVDKKKAYKSFKAAIKNHPLETILEGTRRYATQTQRTDKQYIKHPSTFLNNDSFIDGYEEGVNNNEQNEVTRRYSDEYDLPF